MSKENNKLLLKISPFVQNETCMKNNALLYITMTVFQRQSFEYWYDRTSQKIRNKKNLGLYL